MQNDPITRLENAVIELEAALMAIANPDNKDDLDLHRKTLVRTKNNLTRVIKTSIDNLRQSVFRVIARQNAVPDSILKIADKLHPHGYVKIMRDGRASNAVVRGVTVEGDEAHIRLLNDKCVNEELVFRTNISKSGATITPYQVYQRIEVEDVRLGDYAIVDDMLVRVLDEVAWSKKFKSYKIKCETRVSGKVAVFERSSKRHDIYPYAFRFSYDHIRDQIDTSWSPMSLSLAAQTLICEAMCYISCGSLVPSSATLVEDRYKMLGKSTYATALLRVINAIMPAARVNLFTDGDDNIGVLGRCGDVSLHLTKDGVFSTTETSSNYDIVTSLPACKDLIARIAETLPHY